MHITHLPFYKCHKTVRAAKIIVVGEAPPGVPILEVELPDGRQLPIPVDQNYIDKHKPQLGGYYVVSTDGYESYSPRAPFEAGYTISRELPGVGMTFGQAIESLKNGRRVAREGWNGKGLFVFMQVPSEIHMEVVPRMTSLQESARAEFLRRGGPLRYSNQLALVHPDNRIHGWSPSVSDALAEDWHELPD
jgi:hypothetical protein